jgi:HEAT repeat protein
MLSFRWLWPLKLALRRSSAQARRRAAFRLGDYFSGDAEAVGLLVGILTADNDPRVRIAALASLTLMPDHRRTPALISALDDADPQIRSAAATALGSIVDEAAKEALRNALVKEPDGWVKARVAHALAKLSPVQARDILGAVVHHDVDAAISMMNLLVPRMVPDFLKRTAASPRHMQSGNSANRPSRLRGRSLSAPELRGNLIASNRSISPRNSYGISESAGRAVTAVMVCFKNESTTEHLVQLLDERQEGIAPLAAEVLGETGDNISAVPQLCDHLKDTDRAVAYAVTSAVAMLGDRRAVPSLIEVSDWGESHWRPSLLATLAMSRLDGNATRPVLHFLLGKSKGLAVACCFSEPEG